jgi:hypothetical protein
MYTANNYIVSAAGSIAPPIARSKHMLKHGLRNGTQKSGMRWKPWAIGSLWMVSGTDSTTSTVTSTLEMVV